MMFFVHGSVHAWGNPKMNKKLRFSKATCDNYEVPLTFGIYTRLKILDIVHTFKYSDLMSFVW